MRYYYVTISFIFIISLGHGQVNNKIYFDQLFIPGTLAQNPIKGIAQDRFGLMWFANNDGIYSYNGYNFDYHKLDLQEKRYVIDYQSITFINDSILMVGTGNAGIGRFNYLKSTFTIIPFKGETKPIGDLIKDKNQTIWVNCGKKGIGKVVDSEIRVFNEEPIGGMSVSPTGVVHYASGNNLYKIDLDQPEKIISAPNIEEITSIGFNGSNLLIGTHSSGLFELGANGLTHILEIDDRINQIFLDNASRIWVLTHNDGVYLYDNNNFNHLRKEFYNEHSLSSDRLFSIYQDKHDIVWIGSSAGINKHDPYKSKFRLYNHLPLDDNSLSADLIRGIFEDNDSTLWVATEDGNINKLDDAHQKFLSKKINLPGNKVIPYDFFDTGNGYLYVATSHGIFVVDKSMQMIRPHPTLTYEALNNRRTRSITPYKDNLLILSEGKIIVYNPKSNTFDYLELINDNAPFESQSVYNYARTIYVDEDENLWIGSYGVVAKVNIVDQSAEYYPFDNSRGPMVMYIERLADTLWVGTFNGGLVKIDLKTKNYKKYTTKDGLPNDAIYTAISDENGNLWLSTNNGICRFDIDTEETEIFDINDGLQGAEFNRLAFVKRKNGQIALGGVNGFNLFDPNYIEKNPHSPKSIILGVEILNEFVGNNEYLHPKISLLGKETLNLRHENNFLRFNYCTNLFSTVNDIKYYYQLENFDKNWVNAGNKNSATYTGLKHGNYIFKVKSISPDGVEEVQHASVNININAPFWMKWWFYAILVSLVGLITYVAIDRRLKQTKAIKLLLEKEIERRTHELKKSKDELSDLNQKKDFIFSILSHDLRAPLTTLEGFLGLLVEHYEQMTPKEIKAHASSIKNSVGKSLDLIDNTLYWSLSQMGNVNYNPMTVSVSDLFDKVKGLYSLTAKKKSINLTFDTEDDLFIAADENMSYIILRNLVSNALKFTPKYKAVNVRAYKEGGFVAIEIVDEGIGITPESIKKLFDKKPNLSQRGTSNEKGAGLGLILCKKFIELHKGEISATSNGSHTTFKVTFPIANRSVSNDPNPEPE
ncbi:MAG: two-component regulator propeller domain-containing protein [Fulvivirga sp.]